MTYLVPVLILGVCGLAAAILLTAASKLFYVEVDERVEKISQSLPQANCGACGYAGCADYADSGNSRSRGSSYGSSCSVQR